MIIVSQKCRDTMSNDDKSYVEEYKKECIVSQRLFIEGEKDPIPKNRHFFIIQSGYPDYSSYTYS